jgi:tRNA(fMet)-specific endonuclease VapC
MSQYLLDTDTISLLQHQHPRVLHHLSAHSDADVAVSVISVQEQLVGWLNGVNRARTPLLIEQSYNRLVEVLLPVWLRFAVVSFLQPAVLRFQYLYSRRLNVGSMDLRIAAIALENGLIVVTRNRRDFGRVPTLVLEDWSV